MAIRAMRPEDGMGVLEIFAQGIAGGHSSFESRPPEWRDWDAGHLEICRLVAVDSTSGEMLGWAALSPVSGRCVYGGVAEVSVYVSERARRRGVGNRLLAELVESSEKAGLWTLQAGVFPENTASLALHDKQGFRQVGLREALGKMPAGPLAGKWRDIVLLERRSPVVGRD